MCPGSDTFSGRRLQAATGLICIMFERQTVNKKIKQVITIAQAKKV